MSEETKSAVQNKTEGKKVQMTITNLIADLESGLDRKAIAAKYGVSKAAIDSVFKHPKLKGKKVHKNSAVDIELVDDDTENNIPILDDSHWKALAEARKGKKVVKGDKLQPEDTTATNSGTSAVGKW